MNAFKVVSLNINGLNIPGKRRIIFDHLRKSGASVCLLQETLATLTSASLWRWEWGGPAYFNNGTRSSRGVAILVSRNFASNVLQVSSDYDGRILFLDLEVDNSTFTIGMYYAPTQDKPQCQLTALEDLEQALSDLNAENIIIGGDFNCFLDPLLDRNSSTTCPSLSDVVRDKLNLLRGDWGLCDLWRIKHPDKKGFTFRRGSYASRLDLFLVSNHISELVDSCKITPLVHSDHAMITFSVKTSQVKRGPGLWKFDTLLLQNKDFIQKMTEFLEDWSVPPELQDPASAWEWMKFEIRKFVLDYTKKTHCWEKQHIAKLNHQISDLQDRMDEGDYDHMIEIDSLRRELWEIEESKARKMIFRAKCNWALYGEKCSKYFLNLEKRKAQERTLNSLTTEDGNTTFDAKEILEIGREFYADLYID